MLSAAIHIYIYNNEEQPRLPIILSAIQVIFKPKDPAFDGTHTDTRYVGAIQHVRGQRA